MNDTITGGKNKWEDKMDSAAYQNPAIKFTTNQSVGNVADSYSGANWIPGKSDNQCQ